MKKNLRRVATACLGVCVGLALCYVCLVLPRRETPKASSLQVPERDQIIITIAADGSVFLAGEMIELNLLEARLKELAALGRPMAIRADKSAPFKRIVEVMDSAKAASKSPDWRRLRSPGLSAEPLAAGDAGLRSPVFESPLVRRA